jgi:hypothetical protein
MANFYLVHFFFSSTARQSDNFHKKMPPDATVVIDEASYSLRLKLPHD